MSVSNTTWQEDSKKFGFKPLEKSIDTDILIAGGGLTGIITAYLLSQSRKKIVVIEKDTIGGQSSATSYTTAMITQDIDTDVQELLNQIPKKQVNNIWKSGAEAIDRLEQIVKTEKINCEFVRCQFCRYALSDDDISSLKDEEKAIKQIGYNAKFVKKNDLGFYNMGYLQNTNQAKFNPVKFINALVEILLKKGVKFYEKTEVLDVTDEARSVTVKTKNAQINARYAVAATYLPVHHHTELFAKKGMYTTYMLEVDIQKGYIPEGIYQDEYNPYHYFRIDPKGPYDRMLIGGEDHRSEIKINEKKSFEALEKYLKFILKDIKYTVKKRWTGPIVEPSDGIALIGRLSQNYFVATGYSGNGMTYSSIAARLFTDIITKKKNPYIALYDPKRLPNAKQLIKKGLDYTEEFFGGAAKNLFSK